jgi:hypothetical protein
MRRSGVRFISPAPHFKPVDRKVSGLFVALRSAGIAAMHSNLNRSTKMPSAAIASTTPKQKGAISAFFANREGLLRLE